MTKETLKRSWRIFKRKKWHIVLAVILIVALAVTPIAISIHNRTVRFSAKNPIPLSDLYVKKTDRDTIHLTADKGFSCQAPENTVPAIEKAAEYGFDSVKIDIRQTQDGVWILCRDDTVNSVTDKSGSVSGYTYFDLITCNIDNGANHGDYENLKIPTLEQALKVCLNKNLKPVIEIRAYTDDGIDRLLEIIYNNGFVRSCSLVSDDTDLLQTVHEKNETVKLFALRNKISNRDIKFSAENPYIGICFDATKSSNSEKKISQLQENNINLMCFTNDSENAIDKFHRLGVSEFIVNRIFDI